MIRRDLIYNKKRKEKREYIQAMADLDDFFAKKDRKKKPTKKFVTHEDLSKKIETTTPKVADTKSKKEQPQKPSNPSDNDAENDQTAATEV